MVTQSDLANRLAPALKVDNMPEAAKAIIENAINEAKQNPLTFDVWIYRAVVVVLGLCVLSTVIGGIALTIIGHGDPKMTIPEAIVAIGSASVGALAGLLAPSPKGQ